MTERRLRVLNVNDREVPRYINEVMLKREGFEVVSVGCGVDALSAARDEIDVVLLDVQLPDLDGFEVCRRLKADPATASVIILMTSATFVSGANKITGLDAGADGYLAQPYEPAELRATLRSLLRMRAAEHRARALTLELREAMETRDQFIAMVGHELRSPISVILTALDILELRPDRDSVVRHLPILQRQVSSLTRIVEDLLDVARITHGKVSLARTLVDLRDVAEHSVRSLTAMIRKSGQDIRVELPATPAFVDGDMVRLEQVACNLITNAAKYTAEGGHICVRVSASEARAQFEVSDDGIGMNAELCAHVFDPFVQGRGSIDRSRGGLGLGLSVVRQLVELHGGTVVAFSAGEGHGSRFVAELPLASPVLNVPPALLADEPGSAAARSGN
jgi:two-component system, sensor histidine kinase